MHPRVAWCLYIHTPTWVHSPAFGNSLALATMSTKIHWAFLFVNRTCLDVCPDKGKDYKHNVKLPLCLCSSQKLSSLPLHTDRHGSRCWRCRNSREKVTLHIANPLLQGWLTPLENCAQPMTSLTQQDLCDLRIGTCHPMCLLLRDRSMK